MKNKFTTLLKISIFAFLVCGSTSLFAQPSNDNCIEATGLQLAADPASCVQVDGDTRNTIDATTVAGTPAVCSGSWYTDDVWFTVDIGATIPAGGITVETEFGTETDDVPAVGMAIYQSCDASETPLACFSNGDGTERTLALSSKCLLANNTYIVRVWSGGEPTANAGTFRICAYETPTPAIPTNVLWGDQPGEGDFDGGINGWTIVNDLDCDTVDLWQYSPDATATMGAYFTGGGVSQSPSFCNGAMAFDSDFYDNNGNPDTQGGGICPAAQIGELVSPKIDLSAVSAGVFGVSVVWHQATRQFNSTYILSYSNDGGSNWIDITVNEELETNSPHINEFRRVFLPDADLNATEFQIKFRYEANYYYWIIDDVQIVETERNNMQANGFYALAPNRFTAKSQTDTVRFLIDVENVGSSDATGVEVDMTIRNSGGDVVYNEVLEYGNVAAQFVDENRIFPGFFLPPAVEEDYTATYTVSSDSVDFDPSNNVQSFTFSVSDSTMAKEDNIGLGQFSSATEDVTAWSLGSHYYINHGSDPNNPNVLYECSSVLINVGSLEENQGGVVSVFLYEWEDVNGDGISQAVERGATGAVAGEILGNFTFVIDTMEQTSGEDILITLDNFSGAASTDPILLKDQTNYVLAVGLSSPTGSTSLITHAGRQDNPNFVATSFMSDSLGLARYLSFFNGSDGDAGLGSDLTVNSFLYPRIRMHIGEVLLESVNQPLGEGNTMSIFPNPTTDVLNLELDLTEQMGDAVIRIIDVNARTVMERRYSDLDSQTLIYDVSNLPTGNYFIRLQSDKGYATEKFSIAR
ncbi:MAG: T9SS type A sorting domain-containing protein [Bacteroidota bacterium]